MMGKREWMFPDAELPPMGSNPEMFGHESIVITNPGDHDASVEICLYWTDREPTRLAPVEIKARRVRCVRVTEADGILGVRVEVGEQYAIGLKSDEPIVAQYGRLDLRSGTMAFYTTPGYAQ